jgi:hypothetical protein
MTLWSPEYRIKVNDVVSTSATLSGLTITSGRTSIYSQPIAGYCNLTLIETNVANVNFDVNDSVTVEVKDTSGTYVYLFGGFITDVSIIVQNSGSSALTQKINIIAVGALARLSRTIYTGNLPHQFDGDRIAYLLALVLFDTWSEVPASTTWANYDPTVTWANAENSGYGQIDTPGDYELHSLTNLNATIYDLASSAALSGLGYLYEDAQGRIGYADSTRRSTYLSTNGYIDLDANHSFGPNLQITKKSGDVRNSVTISYGATGASSVTDSDPTSIALYGELASTISTNLKNQIDAENQADFYLDIRSYPQYELKQISFPLGNSEIDNSDRNSLLNVFMGMPINLSNMPANMVNGSFQGFVEGWTWTAGLNSLTLILNVSPISYSLQAMRWNSVPATETWQTLNPTLDWLNATIVA